MSVFPTSTIEPEVNDKVTMNDSPIVDASQIPYEIYEAAYEEGPEEERMCGL